VGRDAFCAYSPEREDPGRVSHGTKSTPKLVGGVDEVSGSLAAALYRRFVDDVHEVGSAEVAEAAKLMENIYRAVNIALVNELKVIFAHQGIDVWEVIEAARTKPFGFQAFYPGPGLGGHCIPIDPYYLEWWARRSGDTTRFIELAGEINRQMPARVVRRVGEALGAGGGVLSRASVLVLGVAYKKDVDDIRESPAAEIITLLRDAGARVAYHDPFVPVFPAMRRYDIDLQSVPLDDETIAAADGVVIVTDHTGVDYGRVARGARVVVDTRNAIAGLGLLSEMTGAERGTLIGGGELWKA
jgi:UDP-N-acetyl-D-glucosamine dehydrogenase